MTASHDLADGHRAPSAADRAVLGERTRVLARPSDSRSDRHDSDLVVLALTVAEQACALEVRGVREVLPTAQVTRLPWPRPPLTGVTNVRGEIVPVAEGRQLLNVPDDMIASDGDGPVIVLQIADQVVGLRVDAVDEVTSVPATDLVIPQTPVRIASDLVRAVTPTLIVLDVDAVCAALTDSAQQEDMP